MPVRSNISIVELIKCVSRNASIVHIEDNKLIRVAKVDSCLFKIIVFFVSIKNPCI